MRYVLHVTLTTAHVRDSYPEEVGDAELTVLADLLSSALDGAEPEIPGVDPPGCTLTATRRGRCLLATVWTPARAPLATIGVAAHSRCGSPLWRILHGSATSPVATRADDVPPEPWCAVLLEVGLASHPAAAHWLGDFERCLAWSWLHRVTPDA